MQRTTISATDPIDKLADHVVRVRFEDIPPATLDISKRFILDALATTIAGANAPMVEEMILLLGSSQDKRESTVAIHGNRLPSYKAGMLNIMMCHALELDEFHDAASTHGLVPAFWSALAAAETIDRCDGKSLLTATILGADVKHRIGLAAKHMYFLGYHKSRLAAFASAAATGRILGVKSSVLRNAFGIAYCQSAGTIQTLPDGALTKRLQPVFNSGDGIRAIKFAQAGIEGVKNVLSGPAGLFALYNNGECDSSALLSGLGSNFLGATASVKRYPCCRCANGPVEATIAMANQHEIHPDAVEGVDVHVSGGCFAISGAPIAGKSGSPQVDAQFSIDYNIAVALIFGDVFVQHFEPAAIEDSRTRALASRVKVFVDPSLDTGSLAPVTVEIRLKSGGRHKTRLEHLKGTPANPMNWDEIISERLHRCLAYSAFRYNPQRVSTIIEMVRNFESLKDVRTILHLLQPTG